MSAVPEKTLSVASGLTPEIRGADKDSQAPLCFVIESDASVRHFLSLILHGAGLNTEEFDAGQSVAAALARRAPDFVVLDVALESAEAVKCLTELVAGRYHGHVQLISSRGSAVLTHVKNIGEQFGLQMLPVLKKPIPPQGILNTLQQLKLGHAARATPGRVKLHEALSNEWVEFWYQPKINLRKKQLVGAELFARVRHPQHGIMMPDAFMSDATDSSQVKLAEYALITALKAGLNFAKLGIHLQLIVNVSAKALGQVRFPEILETYRPQFDRWPGLVIDLAEEQIIDELPRVTDIAKELKQFEVAVAIDNCGRHYERIAKSKELPFAEIKLDRTFVANCAIHKTNAPLCKNIIEFAHNCGCAAVAIGIEKGSDAVALLRMGCDFGQGFLLGEPMPETLFLSLLRQRATGQPSEAAAPPQSASAQA